ncbi:MAG: hypothetical protein RL026_2738 [Pseudomonadota bacterium]
MLRAMKQLIPLASMLAPASALAATVAGITAPAPGPATEELTEVVIFGRAERLIGTAGAASEGVIAGADLAVRPLLRVAELLEAVPGMIAVQHSGTGKANQYFLRGFNLDHGTDFTTYVDDVPLNLRSHGHGQGYLDLNGLLPEIVQRLDFRKGPYRADLGDSALAGATLITTVDRFEAPYLAAATGSFGWHRLAAGGSTSTAGGTGLLVAGQWQTYDGPWELAEALQHAAGYAKLTGTVGEDLQGALSLSSYHATWRPSEQIPERAIGTAVCEDAYCSLDGTATGRTDRHILTASLRGADWRATAWSQFYDWAMLSNPTYDAQIRQADRRFVHGGRLEREGGRGTALQWRLGTEVRHDDVQRVRLDQTQGGLWQSTLSQHAVSETSLALYSEGEWRLRDDLRLNGGLRLDRYRFSARSALPGTLSGAITDSLASPKLGLAWRLQTDLEAYANWGRGFHSNDARGVAASEPAVPGLVTGEGRELGLRWQHEGLSLTGTYWWLDLDSELKFVGDSNSVEPGAGSQRRGLELVGFWRPRHWLAVDASWTLSRARFTGSPGADRIPGAVEAAGEFGVAVIRDELEAGLRIRHLGPYSLVEDNSDRAGSVTTVNLRLARHWGPWQLQLEALNLLARRGKDIVYRYESFVAGLDTSPVDGRLSRVQEPRTLRLGVEYRFR